MHLVKRAAFLIRRKQMSSHSEKTQSYIEGSNSQLGSSSGGTTDTAPANTYVNFMGVGVFVTDTRAVTVSHTLGDAAVGSSLDIYIPVQQRELQVSVVARDEEFDYAVLECEGTYPHHLQLYSGSLDALSGEPMAFCEFSFGRCEDQPDFASGMGVMHAEGLKLSKSRQHLIFKSEVWTGDSLAALLMYEGQLVGLHVAGVNWLRESLKHKQNLKERLSDVEESLEEAVRSVRTGWVAVLAQAFAHAL